MSQEENRARPVVASYPDSAASAETWVRWYWSDFLPAWIVRAHNPSGQGYFDALDANGAPQTRRQTVLAQARLLFTFAHMALLSGNPAHHAAARRAYVALAAYRKPNALYCRALPAEAPEDRLATSYDQSFVILGLSTWGKLEPSQDTQSQLEACWAAIEGQLIDPATGLLLEHDGLTEPASSSAPSRAQNPHMHLYEAALQAFEMTGRSVWMDRAKALRGKGLEYFFDENSGTITEFLAPDLTVLPARDGQRREIGHQCEWAWLLQREVALGGNAAMGAVAAPLLEFADRHGFAEDAPMKGAAFDAVSADTSWREDRFLLWPQTEALKTYAIRASEADYADKARALVQLIFVRYFKDRAGFANQLDAQGAVLWDEGLSRLHYHFVLALTEGARAGLWDGPE